MNRDVYIELCKDISGYILRYWGYIRCTGSEFRRLGTTSFWSSWFCWGSLGLRVRRHRFRAWGVGFMERVALLSAPNPES